ncbi:MAG TPA: CHAT domain-containing protein, partial [Blastocatellia bacterium]|nr:CHAT domain-containing protein [Blastocatellia bacterium]
SGLKKAAIRARGPMRWIRRWGMMKRLHKLLVHIDHYKHRVVGDALSRTNSQAGRLERRSLLRTLVGHPRNRHTIAFLVLPDRVFVASIGWLSLDFGVSPLTRLQLSRDVSCWLGSKVEPLGRDLSPTPEEFEPGSDRTELQRCTSAWLAENLQICDILESLPSRVGALTIVPDDSLHAFPFAALVHRNKYLIEHYPIALSFHIFQGKAARQPLARALMVGVSKNFQSREYRFQELPGTIKELNRLEPMFKELGLNVCRMDDGGHAEVATKEALLTELGRTEMAHIACHGVFRPDQPDQSGMLLVRDGQVELLSLRDLTALNLSGMRHITLSACWLNEAFVLPTRRVISLPETLLHAGAGSVLGSLWRINDDLAVEMMQTFYNALRGKLPDAALQQAQLACLKGKLSSGASNFSTSESFYWAGLSLYGDVSPLFQNQPSALP